MNVRTCVTLAFAAAAIVWLGACERAKAPTPPSGVPQSPTAPNPSITGFVHEGVPLQTLGIADVHVQVEGGALDGQSTKTDSEGRFSFQGVATSGMALTFTKTGYEGRRHEMPQGGTQQTDVQLVALPPVARLDLRVDSIGSTHAIMGYSPIRFDATSSVAVRPTYLVEFGDGGSTSDATSIHPCVRSGSLTARLTIADAFGRIAIATSRYDCVSLVTGNSSRWLADETSRRGEAPREFRFRTQDGARITGDYRHPEGSLAAMTATLSGDRHIRITLNSGHMTFDGEVLFFAEPYSIRRNLAVNVQGGPATGQLLRFYYYEYSGSGS